MNINRAYSQHHGDMGSFSGKRAPDPTQKKGKKGVSTFNKKHKQIGRTASRTSNSFKLATEDGGESARSKMKSYFQSRPNSDKMKRFATKAAVKKRMKKANTTTARDDDSLSDGAQKKKDKRRQKSLKGTMPRKMKNLLSGFYKTKPKSFKEASDEELDLLQTERDLINEAEDGSTNNNKFKEAMLQKYANKNSAVGTYGFSMDNMAMPKQRRESNFGDERPMVLLLGRAKAGKSTLFKQLMTLSGAPPNYARAYRATKRPVEEDISIEDADLTLVDVGGSNEDIVDWRFYLTSAEVIVYVVALDEYDRVIPGKEGTDTKKPYTYLTEALELFDSIIRNVALLNSKFVLVLNKADRFKKKLSEKKISLSSVGAYENAPMSTDYDDGIEFIENLFLERADNSDHEIEVEVTSAIDSEACADVLDRLTQRLVRSKDVTKWKNLL